MKTQQDAIEAVRAQAAAALEELVTFCLQEDYGRCFPKWPRKLVRGYLAFHIRQRTACFVRRAGNCRAGSPPERAGGPFHPVQTSTLMAVGVAWQIREEFVRRPEFTRKPWLYHHNDADGECLYIDNLIATHPAGIGVLLSELQFVWPEWRRLKLFAKRRGRLVEYAPEKFFARVEAMSMGTH